MYCQTGSRLETRQVGNCPAFATITSDMVFGNETLSERPPALVTRILEKLGQGGGVEGEVRGRGRGGEEDDSADGS